MNEILLEVKDLKTVFNTEAGEVVAVDNISFTLHRGETLGIVGESGSGKSVTSLSIIRLITSPPGNIANGQIIYHPKDSQPVDLLSISEKEMQKYRGNDIAMIFQEPMTSLNPIFKCGDQVAEAILLHQDANKEKAKQQTIELFKKVKLANPERIYNVYPHQISGGQKQRVLIAMALSCNPDILIADEPTTALDVTVQKAILDLLYELQQEIGAAQIFITHDLGVVAEIADRVLVMYKGKIVETGQVQEIFTNPKHPYTKGLLACRPRMERTVHQLPVISDFMDTAIDENGKHQLTEKPNGGLDAVQNEVTIQEKKDRKQLLYQQEPILQVTNLITRFPKKKNFFGKVTEYLHAVDDVSFEVFPGETLGLVGESGCGKTTLGRSILKLVTPHTGKVIFEGKDLLQLTNTELRELRRDIQIVFQDPYSSLNPRMMIGQAIMEPMIVHKIHDNNNQRKQKVIDLLETVNLKADHFNRYPHEFSGGQRQRICIARALSLNPRFLICDESVSALDVSVQAQVLNLLVDLREQFKFTYIFISHDLSVVKHISDRMIVMNKGKIEEIGLADDIYKNPKSDYTKGLIEAIPKGLVGNKRYRSGEV